MTPEALARLHARCFETAPRPWSAAEFADLLAQTECHLSAVPEGFALGRSVAGEAELLTLAVAPEARRRGLGRRLTAAFEAEARARRAREAFLEVAAENAPARALYAALGWRAAGTRRGYFGPGQDAIVLRKDLLPPGAKA
jgi:ribosomal-protein-alanine N-acetyltransferase